MNAAQSLKADERTITILRANPWGLNFVLFALLIDVMFRSVVYQEAPWDLFALLGISGATVVYAARHNVSMLNWKIAILMGLVALVAAVVAFILTMTKAM